MEALVKKILEDIERYDGSNRAFSEIVNKFLETGPSPDARVRQLARRFSTSLPTIRRWAKGQSAPHPLIRPTTLDEIRRILTAP